jgi:serine/threonine protein kinase
MLSARCRSVNAEVPGAIAGRRDPSGTVQKAVEFGLLLEEGTLLGKTVSHYRILRQLGAGGMGVVYEAEDTRLRRNVAVKFLSSELAQDAPMLERFEREARAASALNHPGICTVHAIEQHEGQSFIVMELVEGEPLSSLLSGKPMEIGQVLDLGIQLADALESAHGKGIVHRDLKPMNMMVNSRGQVKILDFGLAKFERQDSPNAATVSPTAPPKGDVTIAGSVFGTVQYMSPEQARGLATDARTDVFSLRRHPEPRPPASRGGEPGDAPGARADHREGAREGP